MIIKPANYLHGAIELPGDKSISHRAVMAAAMAEGTTQIENFATGEDCRSTIQCFRDLGVQIEQEGNSVTVHGVGKKGFCEPAMPLDCGNSGTTMRLLAGILAGQGFDSVLTGDESLKTRPMSRIIDPLKMMGAEITSENGCAPLSIRGHAQLRSIRYEMPVLSAQVKSCVMFAGLYADGKTEVIENAPTRDHTERILRWFGADVKVTDDEKPEITAGSETASKRRTIAVNGDSELRARNITIPGDISSAAFFIVAAACLSGSALLIRNCGINRTRSRIIDILSSYGAAIELDDATDQDREPVANIRIRGGLHTKTGEHRAVINGHLIPNIIDELPVLAIFGTQVPGGIEIRDAAELRKKESDRIASVCENLTRMGASVTEFDDGFRVERAILKGATVDSFGDHRIAMAFAVAGLLAEGETEILGSECCDVSFPKFFQILETATA